MEYYHQQLQDLLNPNPFITPNPSQESVHVHHADLARDRLPPQWTHDETKELLALRAQLDQSFIRTKRNKSLWQSISTQLQEKGFQRTPDQCKSKWKNLVARYKGSENMDQRDATKQIPFYEEMSKLFSERMGRLLDFEKGKGSTVQVQPVIENWEEEDHDISSSSSKKRKKLAIVEEYDHHKDVESILREFIQRQMEMEMRCMEAAEAREVERRDKEEERRRYMEALQAERMERERKWREREDARRARAEARAERRHVVIMAILDELAKQGV